MTIRYLAYPPLLELSSNNFFRHFQPNITVVDKNTTNGEKNLTTRFCLRYHKTNGADIAIMPRIFIFSSFI